VTFAAIEARVNTSVFARLVNASATYTPGGGAPTTFDCVFDASQAFIDANGMQTLQPVLHMQPAALANLEQGMQLNINAVNYLVRSVEPLAEGGYRRVALARA